MDAGRVDNPLYWAERYESGRTGWDMGHETPVFRGLRARGEFPLPPAVNGQATRLWVPGCGYGHDAVAFALAGYDVTAVDFAEQPLQVLQEAAARAGAAVEVVQADVFALPGERFAGTFDVALEYTCYCALPPERRADYVRVIADSLVPGGWFVGLLFPVDGRSGGPPFAVDREEAVRLLTDAGLVHVYSVLPEDSHPARLGKEWLAVFRKPS